MKYVVEAVTGMTVGPGQRMKLSKSQIATREHALVIINDRTGTVETKAEITFKAGETVEMAEGWESLNSYYRSVLTPEKGGSIAVGKTPTPVELGPSPVPTYESDDEDDNPVPVTAVEPVSGGDGLAPAPQA